MKKVSKALLLLAFLPFFTSCEPDDDFYYTDNDRRSKYEIVIGTHIPRDSVYNKGGYLPETNPNGSIKVRLPNGDVQLLKKQKVNLTLAGQYTIEGAAGKYSDPFNLTVKSITTNDIGDFYTRLGFSTRNYGEKIVSVNELTVLLSTTVDGRVYEKTFKYSSQTLWDIVKGTYNIFGELGLYHQGVYEGNITNYSREVLHVFDISSDIVLELK